MNRAILISCMLASIVIGGCAPEVPPAKSPPSAVPDEALANSVTSPKPTPFPVSRNNRPTDEAVAPTTTTPGATSKIQSRSVWEGVYSSQQRDRGEDIYRSACVRCHGDDLLGNEAVPTLAGDAFLHRWRNKRAGNLFSYMSEEMPPKETLTSGEYADLLAFLFSKNDAPVGQHELPDNFRELQAIRLGTLD